MKDILKNIFIGIALLGILWASLAIVALALFAFIMGCTRLYFYVHYPTDVLGGVIIGVMAGALGYWLVKKVQELKNA